MTKQQIAAWIVPLVILVLGVVVAIFAPTQTALITALVALATSTLHSLYSLYVPSPRNNAILAKIKAAAASGASVFFLTVLACAKCTPPSPAVVGGIQAGVDLAICVVNVYAIDTEAGASVAKIAADELQQCGADAAQVARILDAHVAAEAREGSPAATQTANRVLAIKAALVDAGAPKGGAK